VNIIISVFLQARKQIVDCILPVMTKNGVEKKHKLLLDESHLTSMFHFLVLDESHIIT
jgi:hypothetical protein